MMVTTSRLIAAISHCLPALPVCRSRRNCPSKKSSKNSSPDNMDGNAFLTEDAAFINLQKYFQEKGKDLNIHQLFVQDPERFNKYK